MTPRHSGLSYQPHIDGLRTVAVLPVLLFHALVPGFSGGFVGVDVFFVISGFLITSILRSEIAAGTFSFARFYERRIRRLIPAQVPVLLFSALCATLFFVKADFVDFTNSLFFTTIFSANWYFLATSGYFDAPADVKLLLHNWSLSVEEQYYFLFPFVLLLARRVSARGGLVAICGIAFASFAYAQHLIASGEETRAFLHSGARFWELMIGSLLTFVPAPPERFHRIVAALRAVGLAMILAAVFLYTKQTPFPGLAAALPTLGTALVIYGGTLARDGSLARDPVGALLSTRPFVYVGRISYSLYLWHWPVLVACFYLLDDPSLVERALALVVAFAASAASYRWIEQPFRTKRLLPDRRGAFAGFAAVSLATVAAVGVVRATDGLPQRFAPDLRADLARGQEVWSSSCRKVEVEGEDLGGCLIGAEAPPALEDIDVIVWGDSLAATVGGLFEEHAAASGETVLLISNPACASFVGVRKKRDQDGACPATNDAVMAMVERSDARLVLVSAWRSMATGNRGPFGVVDPEGEAILGEELHAHLRGSFEGMLDRLGDREVVVLGQPPRFRFEVDSVVARNAILGRPLEPIDDIAKYREGEARAARVFDVGRDDVVYLPTVPVFCDEDGCDYAEGRVALFHDQVHVNVAGAERMRDALLPALAKDARTVAEARP